MYYVHKMSDLKRSWRIEFSALRCHASQRNLLRKLRDIKPQKMAVLMHRESSVYEHLKSDH
jgi:Cft2 family RNA processing exonuclease